MRYLAGVLSVFLIFSLAPAAAQSPQYRPPAPTQEECPQGRQIRAQKAYPSTMTDCEVLDADTAEQNQRLRRQRANPAPPPGTQPVAATPPSVPAAMAPKPAVPAAPPAPVQPAPTVSPATLSKATVPAAAAPAPAAMPIDYDERLIGNWLTRGKFDRFGDGGSFSAMTIDNDGIGFGVRCLQRDLSLAILVAGADPKPLDKGESYLIKLRVDNQPLIETKGIAIGDRVIQIVTEKQWVHAMRDAKEAAVRMENSRGVYSTHIYKMAGAPRAFADLLRECPLD